MHFSHHDTFYGETWGHFQRQLFFLASISVACNESSWGQKDRGPINRLFLFEQMRFCNNLVGEDPLPPGPSLSPPAADL